MKIISTSTFIYLLKTQKYFFTFILILFIINCKKDPSELLNRAQKLAEEKNYKEALKIFEEAQLQYEADAKNGKENKDFKYEILFAKANTMIQIDLRQTALKEIENIIKEDPKNAKLYFKRSSIFAPNEPKKINADLLKANQLDPENIEYADKYATFLDSEGRYDLAISYYSKVAQSTKNLPDYGLVHVILGKNEILNKNYKSGITKLEEIPIPSNFDANYERLYLLGFANIQLANFGDPNPQLSNLDNAKKYLKECETTDCHIVKSKICVIENNSECITQAKQKLSEIREDVQGYSELEKIVLSGEINSLLGDINLRENKNEKACELWDKTSKPKNLKREDKSSVFNFYVFRQKIAQEEASLKFEANCKN